MKTRGIGLQILLQVFLVTSLLLSQPGLVQAAAAPDPAAQAHDLLAEMTPEEKVGQLFIAGFKGSSAGQGTEIHDLIANYHLGGVMLSAANDNFEGGTETTQRAYDLIKELQQAEWDATYHTTPDAVTGETREYEYIPLLVGLSQEGDGAPYDQILKGLTPLPSAMALGATWNPGLASQAGSVLGKELSALGVNLLVTTAMDVLGPQEMGGSATLGTHSFGGNAFWVGRLGKAYVQGIHQGANDRMMVVAANFPGSGNADRNPQDQVATVRRTMEQLNQFELVPFYAVTGQAASQQEMVDVLAVSHIRYAGLQGNIRSTTRPVSFDSNALENLMSLQPLQSWRSAGGILMSQNLGSPAVQQYYSPTGQTFNAHQVALNAFLAGHDLLFVDNFISTGDENAYTSLTTTLSFFAQKYSEDSAFAQRVDSAVERILTRKLQMYPSLILGAITPSQNGLEELGQSYQVGFDVAQNAATLISPNPAELSLTLAEPPGLRDRIIFFTDAMVSRQCSTCSGDFMLPVNGLEDAVVRLYGPRSGGQVFQYNLSSFSFEELTSFLDGTIERPAGQERSALEEALLQSNWIVFAMLDVDENRPESRALHRLLSERPDLTSQKQIITFAFNAPFYLDATDISKMTAYYGLYSKTPGFVDVAARLLFGELTPVGSLPVTVLGSGYDLTRALAPEPSQVIPLRLDMPDGEQQQATAGITEALPMFKEGDILPLVTGKIYDRNRHIVPDGTSVQFVFSTGGEGGLVQQITAVTRDGVARANYQIKSTGLLQIQVTSGSAVTSEILLLDISSGGAVAITAIVPTPAMTEFFEPTPLPTPTPEPLATPEVEELASPRFFNWLASMLMIWSISIGIFFLGQRIVSVVWGLRWGLLAAVGGLLMYIYLSLDFPGSRLLAASGIGGLLITVALGILAGWGVGWLWRRYTARSK
jgi:beta-N-acetylhexosaminidase